MLFTAAVSLYGGGAREDNTLPRADELIANKEYDEAIRLLSDYIKSNPDSFSAAQERLQQIVRLRERYNEIANDLLDTLESDPENNERVLELIDLLLTIESPSNPSTRRFLDQVRYLAEFNVNRLRLERIFGEARVLLAENNYSGALAAYASGLDIYQAAYFSSGYGQEAEDTASGGLRNINQNIERFNALAVPFGATVQTLTNLDGTVLPDPAAVSSACASLIPGVVEITALRESFLAVRSSFDIQLEVLQRERDIIGDRSFLSFAGWLITGPADRKEGMTGVMEQFWDYWMRQADDALEDIVVRSYGEGRGAMERREFPAALSAFDITARHIDSALALERSWTGFLAGAPTLTLYGETISSEKAADYLNLEAARLTLTYLREAGNIGIRDPSPQEGGYPALASWRDGSMDTQTAVSLEGETRASFRVLVNELGDLTERLGTEAETFREYTEALPESSDGVEGGGSPETYFTDARNIIAVLENHFLSREYDSAVRQYTIANGDIERRITGREAEFAEGNSLIQGVSREIEGMGVSVVLYPAEGAAILGQMNENLAADIAAAESLVARYGAEEQRLLGGAEISGLYASAREMLARLEALRTQNAALIAAARTRTGQAASLRAEGDRLFQGARAALGRGDFNAARSGLERANSQYDASLAIQESETLRNFRDTQPLLLGEEIVRLENELVVRDVRNWVTDARAGYYAGNMLRAEELLVRAQNRWRVTHAEENLEVENWLALVRGAMSLQSGRTIAATAPLYAEMSQLLSEAQRNYDEGIRLLGGGQRQEGFVRFNAAMANTREVRLIFPMNQDARMLELRIEQQRDTAAFNASFRQRLNEAVAGTKARNLESFATLQDLAAINPRYPGIAAIVSQAEIDIGLRPPPPDPRALARSTELTQSARTVINARDTLRYELARTQLEDAIRLNPDNTQAQTLMDQIQILMTGQGTIVLPAYAMNQYNNAQQEYLRGNFLVASSIVEQLLRNPEYRNSIQLQDLKRRIDAAQ